MRAFAWFGLALSLLVSTASYAVERPLPANAKPGELSASVSASGNPHFLIDGNVRQLSAGTQIRNQTNRLVQPQHIVAQLVDADVPILYTENHQGQIQRIWILTSQEIQQYTSDTPPLQVITPVRTAKPSN